MYSFLILFYIIGLIYSAAFGPYYIMEYSKDNSFMNLIKVIISLFLFALYILYDTNHILQRNYYGDFITASLDYYLDIINIFVNLFSLNNN